MANTTNLDLVELDGSATLKNFPTPYNGNLGKIDAAVGALRSGIAIVSNGDTHAAINNGEYVYVYNHSTLNEGLYTAKTAIAANIALTSSNLQTASGGLNTVQLALNNKINPLLGNTIWADWTEITSYTNGESWNGSYWCKIGKVTYLKIGVKGLTANTNTSVFTLPVGCHPLFSIEFDGFGGAAYLNHAHFKVTDSGVVQVYSADAYAAGFISFPSL